jgi:hypothetical protein
MAEVRSGLERQLADLRTPCRLGMLPRDRLDSDALLGVAAQQIARLRDHELRMWECSISIEDPATSSIADTLSFPFI